MNNGELFFLSQLHFSGSAVLRRSNKASTLQSPVTIIFSTGTPKAENFSLSSSNLTINFSKLPKTPFQKYLVFLSLAKLLSEILPLAKNAGILRAFNCERISGHNSVSIEIYKIGLILSSEFFTNFVESIGL